MCFGELFYDQGLKYKCLLDSTVIEITESFPGECPHCGRPMMFKIGYSIIAALKDAERHMETDSRHLLTVRRMSEELGAVRATLDMTNEMLKDAKSKAAKSTGGESKDTLTLQQELDEARSKFGLAQQLFREEQAKNAKTFDMLVAERDALRALQEKLKNTESADLCSGTLSVDKTSGRLMYVCTTNKVSVYLSPDTGNSRCPVCGKLTNQTISRRFFVMASDNARLRAELDGTTTEGEDKLRKKVKKLKQEIELLHRSLDDTLNDNRVLIEKLDEARKGLERSAETSRLNVIEFERTKAELESVSIAYRTSESMLSEWHTKAMQAAKWAGAWKMAAKKWREWAFESEDSDSEPEPACEPESILGRPLPQDIIILARPNTGFSIGCLLGGHKLGTFFVKKGESAACPECGRGIFCSQDMLLTNVVRSGAFSHRWVDFPKRIAEINCRCLSTFHSTASCIIQENETAFTCPVCHAEYGIVGGKVMRNNMPLGSLPSPTRTENATDPDEEPASIDMSKCHEYTTGNTTGWGVSNADEKATEVRCALGGHQPSYFWVELCGRADCPNCGRTIKSDKNRRLVEVVRSDVHFDRQTINPHAVLIGCRCLSPFYISARGVVQEGQSFTCPACESVYSFKEGRVFRNDKLAWSGSSF